MNQDISGFASVNMTPTRVKSETMTGEEESKFQEPSENPSSQDVEVQEEFNLKIKLYGTVYDYGTRGNETIQEMVLRMVNQVDHGHKPIVNRMLFKTMLDDFNLNLGVPTGALERDVIYECVFGGGKSNINTTDFVREFFATCFHDDWQLNYFDVKLESKLKVSYMIGKLRVHFFPEESIYQALRRDTRFEGKNNKGDLLIRHCDFVSLDHGKHVLLSAKAKYYAGQCFMFEKRSLINSNLLANVPPREMPGHVDFKAFPNVKGEPVTPIKPISGEASQAVFQPSASSTPAASSVQIRKLQTFNDLKLYVEQDLGLKLEPEGSVTKENQRKKKIETFLKEHCQNFALGFPHTIVFSDLEHFIKLKLSIGAVIGVNVSGVENCCGTCFRIGKTFVITNHHVFEQMNTFANAKLSNCYVNFDFKQTEGHAVRFIDLPLLFCSKELDYAIMELDTMCDLPSSFTDLEYSIAPPTRQLQAGENLTLIGHPNGMEKMVNMSCPIKPKKQIEDHLNLAVHFLGKEEFDFHYKMVFDACSNPNTAVYDVSNFFWGSSGSPGILINEKLLVVLHFHGIILKGTHVLEQGILMSSIVEDVIKKLNGNEGHSYLTIDDIFGEGTGANFQPQPMDND